MNDLSIIFVLVFLAASLATYAFYWVFIFNRREQQVINRRLELNRQLRNASVVLATLREERGIRNVSNPTLRRLSDWLTQTGTNVGRKQFVLAAVLIGLVMIAVFSKVFALGLASLLLSIVATAAIMILYLMRERAQRISSFGEQLPDAIDIIVRGVRVGLPFTSAVSLVAREMPDPVGTEFGMLADEIGFGLDVRSALDNLYRRVGQADLLFLTVSVGIQAQTGGNLGEILSRLSRLMRNRANMRLKIRALSAEGRASAVTLSAFPFVLFFLLNFISPTFYGAIRSNPIVDPAIYLGLFLLVVGNAIMYRMVHFKY
ncbi:MAG TPA: type II secretion system F family protein [Steroidobacteraceae bacterium]